MSSKGKNPPEISPPGDSAKVRSAHPGSQQPAKLTMPWNRPRTAAAASGDGESLPEWKLNSLCVDQTLLSPTMRGGLAWF